MRTSFKAAAVFAAAALLAAPLAFAQGRIIIVPTDSAGLGSTGFEDPTPRAPVGGNPGTTLGQQRLNVFNRAADIWTAQLQPKVDIIVIAQFEPLGANVLGSAGTLFVFSDFAGAEYPDTWYHSALADQLAGTDLNPGQPDIRVRFSSQFQFYLGFDGNEGPGQSDLLAVALHELGHGLGFANFVNEATGTKLVGRNDIYSWYTRDVTTKKNWNEKTDAERRASAVNLRRVSWSGVSVKAAVPSVLSPGEPFFRATFGANSFVAPFGAAGFGPALSTTPLAGDTVLGLDEANASGPSPTDGCTALVNNVAGKIVLMDRGTCGFTVKVKNAQNAGAIGVVIADNVAGGPPPGLGGVDPTITIPSGRITLADGNALKAALGGSSPVNSEFGIDTSILAGTDRVEGLMMLAALDPVALGSSISHWEAVASRNQLMEPAINPDLTASLNPPEDLTGSLMVDIGWRSDGDGVPDGMDQCLGSDTRATVVIGACDSGAGNDVMPDGCTVSDRLQECRTQNGTHGEYVSCIANRTNAYVAAGLLTGREKGGVQSCAARSK